MRRAANRIALLAWGLVAVVVALHSAIGAEPVLSAQKRNGRVEVDGADGQLRYWVDRFGIVHAPELTLAAEEYNAWIGSRYRGLFGIEPPGGEVEFVSHAPAGPRGVDPDTGVFRIPHHIDSDGALTRDLMSIPFFQLGVRLVAQWQKLAADCRGFRQGGSGAACARFQLDLADRKATTPGPIDEQWLELRLRELQKARAMLLEMQHTLEGVPMAVPGGKVFTYEQDVTLYPERLKECWAILGSVPAVNIFSQGASFCILHPEALRYPPEWLAERVEGEIVTKPLATLLLDFEIEIGRYLDAEAFEAKLTGDAGREGNR